MTLGGAWSITANQMFSHIGDLTAGSALELKQLTLKILGAYRRLHQLMMVVVMIIVLMMEMAVRMRMMRMMVIVMMMMVMMMIIMKLRFPHTMHSRTIHQLRESRCLCSWLSAAGTSLTAVGSTLTSVSFSPG